MDFTFGLLINSLSFLLCFFLGFVRGFYYLSSLDLIVKRSSLFRVQGLPGLGYMQFGFPSPAPEVLLPFFLRRLCTHHTPQVLNVLGLGF
jgi:hypothetical protein